MALAGVDDEQSGLTRGQEHPLGRWDRRAQQRDVVTERLAESARVDEVALHVDDQQRGRGRIEVKLVRFRLDSWHGFLQLSAMNLTVIPSAARNRGLDVTLPEPSLRSE